MRFSYWLTENEFNRDVLNQYLSTHKNWQKGRRSGAHRDDFEYDPTHMEEIGKVIEAAKQKILSIINSKYPNEWKQFGQWEKNGIARGVVMGPFMGVPKKLPPHVKIGQQFDFRQPDQITVPQDFANVLLWRSIIKAVGKMAEKPHTNTASFLADGVRTLASLFKTS